MNAAPGSSVPNRLASPPSGISNHRRGAPSTACHEGRGVVARFAEEVGGRGDFENPPGVCAAMTQLIPSSLGGARS